MHFIIMGTNNSIVIKEKEIETLKNNYKQKNTKFDINKIKGGRDTTQHE